MLDVQIIPAFSSAGYKNVALLGCARPTLSPTIHFAEVGSARGGGGGAV